MHKKIIILQLFLVIFFLLSLAGPVWSITLTASPNPATMNKTVTFKINVALTSSVDPCNNVAIDYGDGSAIVDLVSVTFIRDTTFVATHTYSRTGHYTVKVYSDCAAVVKPSPAYLSLRISDFEIKRMETQFENGRPEITIQRKEPVPDLYTKINFSGSGFLKGYWEVDGAKRNYVFKQLSIGPEVVLQYPGFPSLPSFTPGSHIVRFVITEPSLDINFPKAVYFVTAEDYIPVSRIVVLLPADSLKLGNEPIVFKWQTSPLATVYLVHMSAENEAIPVFSAYSKQGSYILRPDTPALRIVPGKQYYLQVLGFSDTLQLVAQSEKTVLSFKE